MKSWWVDMIKIIKSLSIIINQDEINQLSWVGCKIQATLTNYYESEIDEDKLDMRQKSWRERYI